MPYDPNLPVDNNPSEAGGGVPTTTPTPSFLSQYGPYLLGLAVLVILALAFTQ